MSDRELETPPHDASEHPDEHRTPDLMDHDHLLENLKALHEETKSDDDDEERDDPSKPSTSSGPVTVSVPRSRGGGRSSDGIVVHQKRYGDPGRFMWIWMLGIRVPALVINGEPNMPIEIFEEVLTKQNVQDGQFFHDLLRNKNVYIKMGTRLQYDKVAEKSDVCRQLKLTTLSMMSRSDIERIMGELRRESRPTKVEHDKWDKAERVHIVHVNFIDLCDDWLEDDDINEDPSEAGTHGYWYKSRQNMRCIECRECREKFTPTDFVLHHHYPLIDDGIGITHHGCTSNLWYKFIEVHKDERSPENVQAWRRFVMNAHRMGKRGYDEAEPQERREPEPMEVEVENEENEENEEEGVEEEEEEEEEEEAVQKKRAKTKIIEDPNDDIVETKQKLHIADFLGPSGSTKSLKAGSYLEEVILDVLRRFDEKALQLLFLKSPDEFFIWIKEMDFTEKVIAQQEAWDVRRKDPTFRDLASANFDPRTGEFEHLRGLRKAPKDIQDEIEALAGNLMKVERERERGSCTAWDSVRKEQKLLQGLSSEATRVLDNKPPVTAQSWLAQIAQISQMSQTLIAPHPTPFGALISSSKPTITPRPESLLQLPLTPLLALNSATNSVPTTVPTPVKSITPLVVVSAPSPVKIHAPIAQLPTPVTPMTPITPVPVSPTVELLKQHISLALQNPSLFPVLYPKLPTNAYEQLSQFLKATTVQN